MDIKIVVGANYGDEGKGLITDYFTNQYTKDGKTVLNVLYNGGAQRAHTVELPDGTRHVFRHLGAGTFAGADTYLTDEFIINPIVLKEELAYFEKLGINPTIYIDGYLRISTPFDAMANQILKEIEWKTTSIHNTCGMGIYETTFRNNHIRFTVDDLFIAMNSDDSNKDAFYTNIKDTLIRIRDWYITSRIGASNINERWYSIFTNDGIIEAFIMDLINMILDKRIVFSPFPFYGKAQRAFAPYKKYDAAILETGQGLALDGKIKDQEQFNTPSNTDLSHVYNLLYRWCSMDGRIIDRLKDYDALEICFVTRSYLTRHGSGPLPHEMPAYRIERLKKIFDETNIPNKWQGELRYALFNSDSIISTRKRITDAVHNVSGLFDHPKYSLAITHLDEYALSYTYVESLWNEFTSHNEYQLYLSTGPTRNDITPITIQEENFTWSTVKSSLDSVK